MLMDTSGWLCLNDRRDYRHAEAAHFYQGARVRSTTNYILAEYVALTHSRGLPRQNALEFSEVVLTDPDVQVVWVDADLHRQAVGLLQNRQDKSYSLCDAVSFILMRERQISEALTTDRHFEQEGFTRLLKP